MHLLYIEDDPRDVELVLKALARVGSAVALVSVPDESTALDYLLCRGRFEDRPPDPPVVIFLDLKLEDSLGSDLISQIRCQPELAFIPLVMLTASRDPLDVAECYRRGANAYMAKSVSFGEFANDLAHAVGFWSHVNLRDR